MQTTEQIQINNKISLPGDAFCVLFLITEMEEITKSLMQLTNNNNNSIKIDLSEVIIDYYDLENKNFKIINRKNQKVLFDFGVDEPNKLEIISSIFEDCGYIILLYDIVSNIKNAYDKIKEF